ncbi:MAG: prephenate dehydrogenase/arogenate dehydrogenase family protein [archaeon]
MSRSPKRTSGKDHQPQDTRLLPKSTIAIVGGTGQMGRLLAKQFKKKGHQIIIISRDKDEAKQMAKKIGARSGNIDQVAKANVVIVSVPIENTVEVCSNALSQMTSNSLLVEISSVKTGVVNRILDAMPSDIEYLSLHPLFGPSAKRAEGQNIIAIPVKKRLLSDRLISSLANMGFAVSISSVQEHDRVMAAVQVMHHYAYLIMAVELAKVARSSRSLSKFLTRSLNKTLNQIGTLGDIWKTVQSIQKLNPYGLESREQYASSAKRLASMDERAISEIKDAVTTIGNIQHPKNSKTNTIESAK